MKIPKRKQNKNIREGDRKGGGSSSWVYIFGIWVQSLRALMAYWLFSFSGGVEKVREHLVCTCAAHFDVKENWGGSCFRVFIS